MKTSLITTKTKTTTTTTITITTATAAAAAATKTFHQITQLVITIDKRIVIIDLFVTIYKYLCYIFIHL